MGDPEKATDTQTSEVLIQILEKLTALSEGIHRAYCMAVCVDYALLHKESDMDPEIAVCVREYLVHPLDALSYTATDIRPALEQAGASASAAPPTQMTAEP